MPFVQMENISHFLSFISRPPISLAAHDVFLTVDLFEQKDPAQVIQCLGAFSRAANRIDPVAFPTTIGGLRVPAAPGALSPQLSGGWSPGRRNVSGGSTGGGVANAYVQSAAAVGAPTLFGKPSVPPRKLGVSSWSKPTDERATAPAWNIAQYGYMGGASQGNQGVSFGARRQITNNPVVKSPTPDDNEVMRKNSADDSRRRQDEAQDAQDVEDDRRRQEAQEIRRQQEHETRRMEEERRRKDSDQRRYEEEQRRVADDQRRFEEEQRRVVEEQRRFEEEQRRVVEEQRREARLRREEGEEEEKKKAALDAERRKWKEEEERKRVWQHDQNHHRELERIELAHKHEREHEEEARRVRDAEAQRKLDAEKSERERERERIRQLERELEKARERERIYEAEKEERRRQDTERMRRDAQEIVVRKHRTGDSAYGTRTTSERDSFSVRSHKTGDRERESMEAERRFLAGGWRGDLSTPPSPAKTNTLFPQHTPNSPVPPPRALPTPPPRKLPSAPTTPSRVGALPSSRYFTQDHLSEPMRRSASWETNDDGAAAEKREQEKKQAYKWARCVTVLIPDPPNPLIPTAQEVEDWITNKAHSMSLLERERERERERQREWEANRREMEEIRQRGDGNYGGDDDSWDVNQYGYADDILDLY